jgi:hypothetical protein
MAQESSSVSRVHASFQVRRVGKSRGRSTIHFHGDTSSEIGPSSVLQDPNPRISPRKAFGLPMTISSNSIYAMPRLSYLDSSKDYKISTVIQHEFDHFKPKISKHRKSIAFKVFNITDISEAPSLPKKISAPPTKEENFVVSKSALSLRKMLITPPNTSVANSPFRRQMGNHENSLFLCGSNATLHQNQTETFSTKPTRIIKPQNYLSEEITEVEIIKQKFVNDPSEISHMSAKKQTSDTKPNTYLLLGRLLGKGAYAIVHQATDLKLKRQVAVKMINKKLNTESHALVQVRVQHEVDCLQSAADPQIVEFKRITEDSLHVGSTNLN